MSHESIKSAFSDAVNQIADNISLYAVLPAPDWNFSISLVWFQILHPLPFLINSGQN